MKRPSNSVSGPLDFFRPRNAYADALDLLEELVDRLVAERRHADALALLHQLDRAARARVRLPRAGRPLDEDVVLRRPPLEDLDERRDTRSGSFANRSTASRCTPVSERLAAGSSARGSGSSAFATATPEA